MKNKYFFVTAFLVLSVVLTAQVANKQPDYVDSTRKLISLVNDATDLIQREGEGAFGELSHPGSRWRQGETYIFVLDTMGNMLVHPDTLLQGKNQINLKDIDGKPIIRGLLAAAKSVPGKPEGWYHYQWPVPGGLLPRWKSAYVHMVKAPSGKLYIAGSGIYNDRMEKEFVIDMVKNAVAQIGKNKQEAFRLFHDPKSQFIAKDAYIFVVDTNRIELVNPAFPNLEGRDLSNLRDSKGKLLVKAMFETLRDSGSGWVNYMWPKPGESVPAQKSAYVSKVKIGKSWLLVGCGVYLSGTPEKEKNTVKKMRAPDLMALVNEAAKAVEQKGEKAFPEFRKKNSKWLHDDIYLFVWDMNGTRVFHAANPASEGKDVNALKDVLGRPIGKMFLEAATSPQGEGWVHYMYPEPGDIFPTWKSSFVKHVTFPSGKQYLIGCGIYNMQMDRVFIEDVVNRAAEEVKKKGKDAFEILRDKKGPFVFMDIYVFVDTPDGTELVNAAQPSMEGKNILNLKDALGVEAGKKYIKAAEKNGSAWVDYHWYKPGGNAPALKRTFVKLVHHGDETYIIGSGYYPVEETQTIGDSESKKAENRINKKRD